MNPTFLTNDFDELTKGENRVTWPSCDADDQPLLLERLRSFRFDKNLWQLVVVGNEDTVVA